MPDQQMRPAPRYPVDRYLVESSKKIEIVNIIDDEIWHQEPVLRPEDEIILRKLHDMLQSTAEDLKMLSGELSKFHQPGMQVKTQPTPLDEEFNEKVHIEEIVNAKFLGHEIIDKPTRLTIKKDINDIKSVVNSDSVQKPNVSTGTQVSSAPVKKKPVLSKNLVVTRPKVMVIGEDKYSTNNKLNNGQVIKNMPAVAYNEFSFKYVEPKNKFTPVRILQVQHMPKINIRSELKEQKVLHLDIIPESKDNAVNTISKSNVAVISVDHEVEANSILVQKPECFPSVSYPRTTSITRQTSRKISKMSTYESSASTNNSDTQHNFNTQKVLRNVIRSSPRNSVKLTKSKKITVSKKEPEKRPHLNLDEWKKKLDRVYGQPSTSKYKSNLKLGKKSLPKKTNEPSKGVSKPPSKVLNNSEYIPYLHLTLGGARVSDIERELSEIPNKNNVSLSPILDKILSSKENSPRKIKKPKKKEIQNIFTTSDENLLQEVIEIEKTVSETISKNFVQNNKDKKNILQKVSNESTEENEDDSYADDFEDEKSDGSQDSDKKPKSSDFPSKQDSSNHSDAKSGNESDGDDNESNKDQNNQNTTFTKATNLSLKESVEVFEFVHSVDTQETATQSNATNRISLKETQTSPRNDRPNIQPIHNDLWPSIDPNGEVEKMFKLEKDFIKKLILEEYGDLLEKNLTKPSTSEDNRNQENRDRNVAAYQKNTQTSPAHVKSVMTSPTRTKTRMTSPFLSVTVDRQTSPVIIVNNEEKVRLEIDEEEDGISINLSSPRFSLRLPQTSREVLSNLEMSIVSQKIENSNKEQTKQNVSSRPPSKADKFTNKTYRKTSVNSCSIDDDNSSSELSSLGEIKQKLKRRLKKRIATTSGSDSSSTVSKSSSEVPSGGILPLKSEGELSLSQGRRKLCKSDGEASFGQAK